jgi:hypothetical protein
VEEIMIIIMDAGSVFLTFPATGAGLIFKFAKEIYLVSIFSFDKTDKAY